MKRFRLPLFCTLGYCTTTVAAADINVIVKEKGTGQPVAEASAVLLQAGETAVSDEKGRLRFQDVVLPDKIKILSIGFQPLLRNISAETTDFTVFLIPQVGSDEGLVVIEDRIEQKNSKITLQSSEINRAPGTQGDPLKVVESLPGIVTSSPFGGGPPGGGFYVRGSDQNQNTAWVNRSPIGYLYHFGGAYSTINPALLKDFNIFLGGFPVEYDDVLGGVLDVQLRSPRRDRQRQQYSLGTYQSSFLLEGPVGKAGSRHGYFLAARRSYIDLVFDPDNLTSLFDEDEDIPEDQRNRITQVPVFYDIQALWEFDAPVGQISARYFAAADEAGAEINENSAYDPQSAGDRTVQAGFHSLSFNWERQWHSALSHTAPLTFFSTSTRFEIGTDENGRPFYFDSENRSVNWQPEVRWLHQNQNQLSVGYFFAYDESPIDAKIIREPTEGDIGEIIFTDRTVFEVTRTFISRSHAPYIKYRWNWTDRFSTTAGVRQSYVDVTGGAEFNATLPRLQAEYEIADATWLTGAWGLYVQTPRGSQLAEGAGNPDLSYTRAEHRIAGLKVKRGVWTAQMELFDKPMTDLVVPIDANPPPDNFANAGEGRAYGLDILLKRDYQGGRTGWLSYSYIKTTRTGLDGNTRRFSGDQPNTLTLVWNQKLPGRWQRWEIGTRFQYHTGLPFDPVIGTATSEDGSRTVPVYPDKKNSRRLPDYYQLDLRIDHRVLFNHWKMNYYFDILNVLNIKNVVGYDYGRNLENIDNPEEQYSVQIFPTFGIEAEF